VAFEWNVRHKNIFKSGLKKNEAAALVYPTGLTPASQVKASDDSCFYKLEKANRAAKRCRPGKQLEEWI
jgi:hypothetical protein